MLATSLEERFWKYVTPMMDDRGCWEWTGAIARNGYGKLSVRRSYWDAAHRIAWKIHNGDVPDNMCVCHKCDNRSCVNPTHMFLGTQLDNMRDMSAKGRASRVGIALAAEATRAARCCRNGHLRTHDTTRERFSKATGRPFKICIPCYRASSQRAKAKASRQ